MNLVVQGERVAPGLLNTLAGRCGARAVERISPRACRLLECERQEDVSAFCRDAKLDWAWVPTSRTVQDYKLFITDMDSTLISSECIDEIADIQGVRPQVAAITEAAMRGEIDYDESLHRRVKLLAGLPEAALQEVYEQRIYLNAGAIRLLSALKLAGLYMVLVSGGFTYFTDRLKARLSFDEAHSNRLEICNGRLTGKIVGPVVNAAAKADHLERITRQLNVGLDQTIAIGDGANDIPMISAAGLGIAYHSKPALRAVADYALDHAGLDGVLHLFN